MRVLAADWKVTPSLLNRARLRSLEKTATFCCGFSGQKEILTGSALLEVVFESGSCDMRIPEAIGSITLNQLNAWGGSVEQTNCCNIR